MTKAQQVTMLNNFIAAYKWVASMSKGDRKRYLDAAEKQTQRFECDTTMNRALNMAKK